MNQQLLALQGIANGSDELGNLLLLDRNEQRDDKEFIQVRLYKPTAKQASYKKDIRCKPCIGFLAAISQLRSKLLKVTLLVQLFTGSIIPKGVLKHQVWLHLIYRLCYSYAAGAATR